MMKKMMTSLIVMMLALGMAAAEELVLFDAAKGGAVKAQDKSQVRFVDGLLEVTTQPSQGFPGFTLKGKWDLSAMDEIAVDFVDAGINGRFTVRLMNDGARIPDVGCYIAKFPMLGADKTGTRVQPFVYGNPEELKIKSRLTRVRNWAFHDYLYQGLTPARESKAWDKSYPLDGVCVSALDPKRVTELAVYINTPKLAHTWRVKRVVARATGKPATRPELALSEKKFFPLIDEYGQFKHRTWPDKVTKDSDFAVQREKEAKDLAAHPGPEGWNKWGGWEKGPRLAKTGHFYVTKHEGKWWFVDPEGCLWWSHGPVRVSPSCATTALDGHDDWFARLPKPGEPEAEFYSTRDQLLFPYYARWKMKRIYDFSAQNIARKYGKGWYETFSDLAHRRLRSWACNTIANSSDKSICRMDRTPYTDRYEIHSRPIAGHKGYWWDFPDPFDPSFRETAAAKPRGEYKDVCNDPWCFGLFVDNEHRWGGPCSFALCTLKSPADQPCKRVFRERLQAKYGEIAKLNAAWKMGYRDWDDFLAVTKTPDVKVARTDLEAFSFEITETYFRIIKEELKKAAPHMLYMGCRWSGANPPEFVVRAAAKHCDILSYNIYAKHLREFKLPQGIDKPVIVGEFHFGALDRGPFTPGLVRLRSQAQRAEVYEDYVRSALEDPRFVGVHWHQFSDQSTAGRFDGENMQVGFTDVCDTPYWETIEAVRKIGGKMYDIRAARQ